MKKDVQNRWNMYVNSVQDAAQGDEKDGKRGKGYETEWRYDVCN